MSTRPSPEDRKRGYLKIGAQIVEEYHFDPQASPMAALANVKVSQVAVRAGVSKGALYHIWPSQEDYRRDLLDHLLRLDEQEALQEVKTLLQGLPRDASADDVLRISTDFTFDRLKDDPAFFARFSFYLYTDEVRHLLGEATADDSFWRFFDSYIRATGRRLREPFTAATLFACVTALSHGLILRHRTSPDLVERTFDHDGHQWRMYSFGTLALIDYFTEPDS